MVQAVNAASLSPNMDGTYGGDATGFGYHDQDGHGSGEGTATYFGSGSAYEVRDRGYMSGFDGGGNRGYGYSDGSGDGELDQGAMTGRSYADGACELQLAGTVPEGYG
jgi:hypothetical protein